MTATTTPQGCPSCRTVHLPDAEMRTALQAEKNRGLWKHTAIDDAMRLAHEIQLIGCECVCHRGGA